MFKRTEAAAKADRESTWHLLEAVAADAKENGVTITGHESIAAAVEATARAGNEKSPDTMRSMCLVAKFDRESTPAQRRIWRRYGWSTIFLVAGANWSPDDAYDLLIGEHKSWRQVAAAVRGQSSCSATTGLKKSLDTALAAWVTKMNTLLMEGAQLAERAETEDAELGAHAELALLIYDRITERKIDAELRELLESEDASRG